MVDLAPQRPFRPSEVYVEHRAEIERCHPEHKSPDIGAVNALNELVREGALTKIDAGLYVRAGTEPRSYYRSI